MSLAVSGNCANGSVYDIRSTPASNDRSGTNTCGKGDRKEGLDTVQISNQGRMRISDLLGRLILPTEANVRRLSATLAQDLGELLSSLSISSNPPLEFTIGQHGEIQLQGNRADKEKILRAINENDQVSEEIRTTAAIASHAAGIAESLKFQKAYRASNDPESVVARYSSLFCSSRQSHQISLVFDGRSVDVESDGRTWMSSAR